LRGLAEGLQQEVRPFHISISVSYPPDTDTPMYHEEMKTKPEITREISDSSVLMSPQTVARDIVSGVDAGYFSIAHGLEGWALKQVHAGLSPLNNSWEVVQQIATSGLIRFVTVFIILFWEYLVEKHVATQEKKEKKQS
jgi:3-dehydrosphinganine reductase